MNSFVEEEFCDRKFCNANFESLFVKENDVNQNVTCDWGMRKVK